MTKYIIIILLLWSNTLFGSDSVSYQRTDSLAIAGDYLAALVAYEQIIYQHDDVLIQAQSLLKKSYAQKAAHHYTDAIKSLFRINILPNWTDSFKYLILYEKALCYYLSHNYSRAKNELGKMKYAFADSTMADKSIFLSILVFNELHEWEQAQSQYAKYLLLNNLNDSFLSKYEELIHKNGFKKKKTAKTLSFIVPGLGQAYSGYAGRGFSSLLLHAGLATYTYISFVQGYPISAFSTGIGYLISVYVGGAKYAQTLANKHNDAIQNEFKDTFKAYILKIENQKKL